MITEFQLIDTQGNILAEGEIDGDIYRLFSADLSGGYQEFQSLKELFKTCGGHVIQPALFQTPARTRQLRVF